MSHLVSISDYEKFYPYHDYRFLIECVEIAPYLSLLTMNEEHEKLVKTSVYLEEEVMEALEELAREYSEETRQKWSRGAVIRLALSEFFSRRGKIL